MLENKTVKIHCDMCRRDIEVRTIWSYDATSAASDYKEHWQFCSYECMIAWLIDDEKVLKLKLRRMKIHREIRHPHSISRAPIKIEGDKRFDEYHYMLQTDDGFGKEKVEVLDFENMEEKELKKEFDKEELESLYSAYSD